MVLKRWMPILLAAALIATLTAPGFGQGGDLHVQGLAVGTDILDRTPQGVSVHFDPAVGKLYAFTQVVGAEDSTQVHHHWYWENQLMAEVTLPVRSMSWRTWSSKQIVPQWTGRWRVEIVSDDGAVLSWVSFTLG